MLAWDWPTNYVIIWCVPRKNRVMPSFGMTIYIHIIFSGNICIHSLLSWVVYTNMFPWELYDPSKMICILYLSCSAGYICICSLRNVVIFSLGLRPRENITTFLRGTYTYIPCGAWYIYTIYIYTIQQKLNNISWSKNTQVNNVSVYFNLFQVLTGWNGK